MNDDTLQAGLLMEAVRSHQQLAESSLHELRAHTERIDELVRDEIRRTLLEQLQCVSAEAAHMAMLLRSVGRAAQRRLALAAAASALLSSAAAVALGAWQLPSAGQVAALRARRDRLQAAVATLRHEGADVDLRRCGSGGRLCVRVAPGAPVYGEHADYRVLFGH